MLKSEMEHVKELSYSLWSYVDDYGYSNGVPLDLETNQDYEDKFACAIRGRCVGNAAHCLQATMRRKSWSIPLFLDTHVDLDDMHDTSIYLQMICMSEDLNGCPLMK